MTVHTRSPRRPAFFRLLIILVLASSGLLLAQPHSAAAATFSVTKTSDSKDGACNHDCSLREAIIAAHQQPGVDTITLSGGTYRVTLSDIDITSSLNIVGVSAATTIIESNGQNRIFEVRPGTTVTIDKVTIRNGNLSQGDSGGISNQGTLTVSNSVVSGNQALQGGGGGIWNAAGNLTIINSAVNDNQSNVAGGIGNVDGTLTLSNSTVDSNEALSAPAGVYNQGTATITGSTISRNLTTGAYSLGGAIWNSNVGTITIRNSTISNNPLVYYVTGGTISNYGNMTIANSTVVGNSGGGIDNTPLGTLTLHNTISAGNDVLNIGSDCLGTIISQGYNLIQNTTGCTFTGDTTGNLAGVNPQLGPLQHNGGPTWTHLPASGSPAVDAGNPATPGSGTACLATDQRGQARPKDGNGDSVARCDIGAVER